LSRNVFDKRVSWLYEMAVTDRIEIHFVSDNQIINSKIGAAEKFNFSISLGLANYYSNAISDNVKRANEAGRSKGLVFTSLPEGYLGRSNNVTLSDNSHLITEAFRLFSSGDYTQTSLTNYLNKDGYKSKNGKRLIRQALFTILRNPFYYGVAKSKHGEYKHTYLPLTTYENYRKCQELLDQNIKSSRKQKRLGKPYAFRNLLLCKECGLFQQVIKEEVLLEQAENILKDLVFPEKLLNM
jgi:site-specific DNA recombinase